MKKIIKITALLILVAISSIGTAQTICQGESTTLTAVNSLNLTNPTYSLNPGGITSISSTFTVTPLTAGSNIYTLYVTGTNSSSSLVTTTNTVTVSVNGSPTYNLVSPQSFTLGCATLSVCTINITNGNTSSPAGGPVSYTLLAPYSSTILPIGALSATTLYSITTAGAWSVVVMDNTNFCTTWATVNILSNTVSPIVPSVSVSSNTISCFSPSTVVQVPTDPTVSYNWLPSATQGNSIIITANPAAVTPSISTILTLVIRDNNNSCESTSIIPIYQNVYLPNASIFGLYSGPICSPTLVLLYNGSRTGIPNGTFPTNKIVAGYLWEGPSPQQPLALSTTYIAQTTGVYTMTAMDMNNGCTDKTTINVTVAPTPAFVHTITGGQAVFNDVSINTATNSNYFWDFGDGNTSTLQNPIHIYVNGGSYLVKFKISTNMFCADSVIQSLNISGVTCSANSNFSMVPTGTAQVWNVVPSYPWNITAASWNWGDGSSSSTLYTAHQYSAAGMYNICLSVTVSCGDTSTSCTSYSVYRTSQEAMMLEVNVVAPELVSGLASVKGDGQISWNIAPNPNAGEFNIHLNSVRPESLRILITDISGRLVHDQFIPSESSVTVHADLPAGMYLVRLEADDLRATKRMVVLH